jgi:SAM-dependent methyltransferase
MNANVVPSPPSQPTYTIDLTQLKRRQQATWSSGDFAVIGVTLQGVGESLCEAVDLHAGETVLDVACGNGNATLAAARRWGRVTGIDYVPELVERGAARAAAEGLRVDFRAGDAESLAFDDNSFDVVLSTYGVMFTADQERAARELTRVCRKGGRIALANWTPEGFIGRLLKLVGQHVPPPAGALSPLRWGTEAGLASLFGDRARVKSLERRNFVFRYLSIEHFIDVFRTYYGPTHKAFMSLDESGRQALARDMSVLLGEFNRSGDATLAAPAEYIEVVLTV